MDWNNTEDVELYREAKAIYETVSENLINGNRFFVDEDFLNWLDEIFRLKETTLTKETKLYRAREFDFLTRDRSKDGTQFEGYDKEGSFVNLKSDWPNEGRMNPQGIHMLYTATDAETCIAELKPYSGCVYSVATINVLNELKIVNLSEKLPDIEDAFLETLSEIIIKNLSSGVGGKAYVLPQFIAGYCKYRGYDGIAYRSKYANLYEKSDKEGINYAIFNYEKCKVIESKIYHVGKMELEVYRNPF